ncbi:MAG: hypothetical protein JSW67_04575 [Candidatus Latescibacterota bacterium]|nr:MAG: hypothetical protein JSW67_04575 [Candidatus Latescibacterota bacterium]
MPELPFTAISWDQTLVSLGISAVAAGLAYRGAARVLRRQEVVRELRARRDALEQVVVVVDGPVVEYFENEEEEEYPQREMVELERRALQAQIYYLRDLEMQNALRDICYPSRYKEALSKIRATIEEVDRRIAAGGRA